MVKKELDYQPFYPTTLGTKSHDKTLPQLPAYSILPRREIKEKFRSPGPGAYPKDEGKKGNLIPKSLYPDDKAFKYSMGVRGKERSKFAVPSPATYPLEKDRKGMSKYEVLSIYPRDHGKEYSMGERRERKILPRSPGPATFPREIKDNININSLFPIEKSNKFTIPARPADRKPEMSPGPAQYPCVRKESKNKVASIYPADTQLLPTMKERHQMKDKRRMPAPNAYPLLDGNGNSKNEKVDLTKKMIIGNRSPLYSMGVKHSPKQHMLILKEDQY